MMNWLKKLLAFCITGSVSVVLAACYGAPIDDEEAYISLRAFDGDQNPIPGLKVKLSDDNGSFDSTTTSEVGYANFYLSADQSKNYQAIIEDIDGDANGGLFKSDTIKVSINSDYSVTLNKEELQ